MRKLRGRTFKARPIAVTTSSNLSQKKKISEHNNYSHWNWQGQNFDLTVVHVLQALVTMHALKQNVLPSYDGWTPRPTPLTWRVTGWQFDCIAGSLVDLEYCSHLHVLVSPLLTPGHCALVRWQTEEEVSEWIWGRGRVSIRYTGKFGNLANLTVDHTELKLNWSARDCFCFCGLPVLSLTNLPR